MNIETLCVHSPKEDKNAHAYGSVSVPIFQTATFYHPGYETNLSQSRGFGGMISFTTYTAQTAKDVFVRLSVGIENSDDLIRDLEIALA